MSKLEAWKRNMKSFQTLILFKKTAFQTTKLEVNKPDLRQIYFPLINDEQNAKTYINVLGN